jgi:farnesyl-diphosphate farnesyltransferase
MPLDLLRRVSRTYYLSLAILPRSLRTPVGLAYLFARAADTIADTRVIDRGERLDKLEQLRHAIGTPGGSLELAEIAAAPDDAAERLLLRRLPECFELLERLPPADAGRVRAVLATITEGQVFDLTRFPREDAGELGALETLEDLDRYTYLVAGCVGEFWTEMHVAHRPRLREWDLPPMRARGVRFGKALQMTNVLRDLPRDLRIGRCYLPRRDLTALGLTPADLLERAAVARVRPLIDRLLRSTLEHYEVAWTYTFMIPLGEIRMRLACAWPLLIGLGTLELLAASPDLLDPARRLKLSRAAVRGALARSAVTIWSNRALAADAARLRGRITRAQEPDGRERLAGVRMWRA